MTYPYKKYRKVTKGAIMKQKQDERIIFADDEAILEFLMGQLGYSRDYNE